MSVEYNKHIAPHQKYLFNFAKKLCRNIDDAEDITQQTLMKAFLYSQKNPIDPNKIKSFLSSTLYNTFIDSKRRSKNRDNFELNSTCFGSDFSDTYIEQLEDSFNYDSIINRMEMDYHISPVLEKLKKYPTLHDSLIYFIQENTYEEIAELMSTNVGNVKSRLFKARKFVKENVSSEFLAKI